MFPLLSSSRYFSRCVVGLLVIFLPWFIVVFFREIGIISYQPIVFDYKMFLFFYIMFSLISYLAGFSFIKKRSMLNFNDQYFIQRYYGVLLLCLLIYLYCSFYDFYIIRGGTISEITMMRKFDNVSGVRNSLFGAIIAIFSGAPPLVFIFTYLRRDPNARMRNLIYFLSLVGIFATFFSGGRNSFFLSIIFIYVYFRFFISNERKFGVPALKSKLFRLVFYVIIFVGFIYSMQMFLERGSVSGRNTNDMLDVLVAEYGVSIYYPAVNNSLFMSIYTIIVYVIFYFTHALNYSSQYFSEGFSQMYYGSYSLPLLARFIDVIFGTTFFQEAQSGLLTMGMYLSFPGGLYVDFGYIGTMIIGVIVSFIFGYLMRNINLLGMNADLLLCYIVVLLLFSPIFSVCGIGNGFSLLFFIVFFYLPRLTYRSGRYY